MISRIAFKTVGIDSLLNPVGCRFFDTYDITNPTWMRYPIDLLGT